MKNLQNMKGSKSYNNQYAEKIYRFYSHFLPKLVTGLIKGELKIFVMNGN